MSDLGQSIKQAAVTVSLGGTVVYPTEGVYGMGCDFRNEEAVHKILQLKQRPVGKGLVLIASHVQQVLPLIVPQQRFDLARALKTWPGHATWVFPKSKLTPAWVSGDHGTVAVRVSQHPAVKALCDQLGQALVSTSANISGQGTASNCQELKTIWQADVDYYLDLPLGDNKCPSSIRLANSGSVLR